jgi:hypothetical protein
MTIVDERGRLFGRFNLIDAGVVVVLLVFVPLAYAAYRLFRPEAMKILSVEPSRVIVGQQPRIRLDGQHLRPYLRAQVGGAQPHNFLIESPDTGEFVLPELPEGTHDLTLFNEVQEVARMKDAITVTPPPAGPRVGLQLIGAFFGLDEAGARAIVKGRRFPNEPGAPLEILDVGAAREDVRRVRPVLGSEAIVSVPVPGSVQVPATLRAVCLPGGENQNCAVNGTIVSPGVTLPVPGGFSFVIDGVRADAPAEAVTVRIQFVGRPEAIDLLTAGDVEAWGWSGAARIVSVGNRQVRAGQVARQVSSAGIVESASTPERLASADADVVLSADQTPTGLGYRSMPLKPGALFTFETPRYVARGTIVSVTSAPAGGRAR